MMPKVFFFSRTTFHYFSTQHGGHIGITVQGCQMMPKVVDFYTYSSIIKCPRQAKLPF